MDAHSLIEKELPQKEQEERKNKKIEIEPVQPFINIVR